LFIGFYTIGMGFIASFTLRLANELDVTVNTQIADKSFFFIR